MKTINPLAGKLPNCFIELSAAGQCACNHVQSVNKQWWANQSDSLISNKTHYVSSNANAAVWLAVQIMAVFSCFSNSEDDLKTFTV